MEDKLKKIQCILSILYTVEKYENVESDIKYVKRLLYKTVHNKPFSVKEEQKINDLLYKYNQLLKSILTGEENKYKIGRIALLNDLCYNYYRTESMILTWQDKNLDSCIENIHSINKDIELFNKKYNDYNYVENNEKKYLQYTYELFKELYQTALN